jgi:lipopolysaccharide transport system ATP-binding protein
VIRTSSTVPDLTCKFTLYNSLGQALATFDSAERSIQDVSIGVGARTFQCSIEALTLLPGRYRMNVRIMGNGEVQDHMTGACTFDVTGNVVDGRSISSMPGRQANIFMHHRWQAK